MRGATAAGETHERCACGQAMLAADDRCGALQNGSCIAQNVRNLRPAMAHAAAGARCWPECVADQRTQKRRTHGLAAHERAVDGLASRAAHLSLAHLRRERHAGDAQRRKTGKRRCVTVLCGARFCCSRMGATGNPRTRTGLRAHRAAHLLRCEAGVCAERIGCTRATATQSPLRRRLAQPWTTQVCARAARLSRVRLRSRVSQQARPACTR